MQDRLIKELRLAGISSIDAANEYPQMGNFIEQHNQKFAIKARQEGNAHKITEFYDLDNIFCIQETRTLANDFTITYSKQIFQLRQQQKTIIQPKNKIIVKVHLNGNIALWIRKIKLSFSIIQNRPQRQYQEEKVLGDRAI